MALLTLGADMARPSRTGGKPTKQRRKRIVPKRRNAPKAMRNRGVSIAGQETVVARLTQERDEALLRETANVEILRLIAKSSGDLELLFRTILENATRICNANFGTLFRFDGENILPVAQFNTPTTLLKAQARRGPFKPTPGTAMEHVLRTKQVSHSADKVTEPVPGFFAEHGGARSQVAVPMLKDDFLIGVIVIYHQEVRPFTDKQIELLQNFASQAVIAIENARLLNELRQRTDDLSEALEQQTATSEVLKVISSSPGELKPVFEAMLASAVRICGAKFGTLFLCEGDDFRVVAQHNTPAALAELRQREPILRVGPGTSLYRSKEAKQPIQIADLTAEPVYFERDQNRVALVELGGYRAILSVPMVKESEVIGAINMYRQDAGTFSDNQVELVKNFATQAVIAIENARLLNELRQSLERQTGMAQVLRVISASPGELEPVFNAMLENATRLCEAKFGVLFRSEGDALRAVALYGAPPAYAEERRRNPIIRPTLTPQTTLGRAVATKQSVQIADVLEEPNYFDAPSGYTGTQLAKLAGARTILAVPMIKENELMGAIVIYRQEVRPFTNKQVELVTNFASQAVIAIENTRLLNELRERTEEVVKLNQQLEHRVADQVGEIERMGRLRRFLPPQVADLIVASGTEEQLESHRREITALFCDLRGFTGFSEASAPEDVMALLRDYHAAIGEIIIKYGGTLERYAGDGVMVVFNDPVPVDNPALRAVLMALETREAMGALMKKWRQLGHDVGFGIGIAHGFATLGTIGFEGRFDYAAIGTVSNVASRLCDEAKPGQIVISPRVFAAVKDAVTVEPMGEFMLKGIGRPLAAYNVLGTTKPAN